MHIQVKEMKCKLLNFPASKVQIWCHVSRHFCGWGLFAGFVSGITGFQAGSHWRIISGLIIICGLVEL